MPDSIGVPWRNPTCEDDGTELNVCAGYPTMATSPPGSPMYCPKCGQRYEFEMRPVLVRAGLHA